MTGKRFENRLDKSNVKFNTLNPTWDNEKETGLNVFEMIDELNNLSEERDYFERKKCEYFNKYNKKHLDNIQLKKENERIKHMIQEAYNNERTQIGKSVLKQLMEQIQ